MDNIRSTYKKDSETQEVLKNVNIEYHWKFNYQGEYVFKKCADYDGPLLGHMTQKCPKLDYDEKVIRVMWRK